MNREEVVGRVLDYMSHEFCLLRNTLSEEAGFVAQGMDSLDVVVLYMEVEDEFDIKIPDEETINLTNVRQLIDLIEKKLKLKASEQA